MRWPTAFVVVAGMSLAAVVARAGDGTAGMEERVSAIEVKITGRAGRIWVTDNSGSLEGRLVDLERRLRTQPAQTEAAKISPFEEIDAKGVTVPKGAPSATHLLYSQWMTVSIEAWRLKLEAESAGKAAAAQPVGSSVRLVLEQQRDRLLSSYEGAWADAKAAKAEYEKALAPK